MGKDAQLNGGSRNNGGSDSSRQTHFDVNEFLAGLDAIFDAHDAGTKAEPYLQQALADAENAADDAGMLTVLNETMGFYRSQGRHEDNQRIIQRTLELASRMDLQGSEAWTTTLINAATGMRAAGQYDRAENLYRQALDNAVRTLSPTDRRMAALHNNLSMLYSETGQLPHAQQELETALHILETASVDATVDIDVASTHTNLALVLLQESEAGAQTNSAVGDATQREKLLANALDHASQALRIYQTGHLEHSAHYASALAGYAQVCFALGRFAEAADVYRHSLAVIAECYGTETDYYRITEENLKSAQEAAGLTQSQVADSSVVNQRTAPQHSRTGQPRERISGLRLARAYWNEYGKALIAERYPEYRGRIAAGLVGHGSECYGFDDEFSQDHDFGPGFCLWLADDDYARIGERLQADYDALPSEFMGYGPRESTARAGGASRRVGVFAIGDFFERLTGYRQAPAASKPHEWLLLDEATLAAATNGEVFADPLGMFLKTRQGFKMMPEDVRLALISRRLGMIAQAGQYNLPRMLARGDGAAAWLSINEFVNACCSLVFLINQPITVGYLPYYKWRFAAMRRLSKRMATRLADVCEQLEVVLRLSSAACFGGAGFGEGGKGSGPAQDQIRSIVDHICTEIVHELNAEGLSDSSEPFLEWQRPYVEEHIESSAAVLHSL
ncbi:MULTISPECIES: DUF4037 domain-containing protein [Bifidobacterium]|jgi:tetratricopeptide (TPR) repeat protein|uniref:DUF4037 domain-containing protein n=1 Tax=Bifidobacterium tibiigranuli TaxID=2172043 RepID=A0A5N6RYQ2_9BIFI|nr:DUF4037 domain-containing protein [Bifidobacterium tibiigranuli]KAE8126997.1 hypothetical protein DDF78_09310 [Bifidobacterium tibiigranuli]KAE8127805.1 DUF4037 domain-containing protein [Bifidobacterium tibiigranuli]MCI1211791.1 DUF4037 domain-containing protein [Bifidobacterium tibiigranuli]MCI1221709.1 DUF4037 domain-containing protein [Bifidobacterium tibiigranuli]MCI1232944.1 DUF4037 domain-containing protein [Bifidobacterium tibiigranuli]